MLKIILEKKNYKSTHLIKLNTYFVSMKNVSLKEVANKALGSILKKYQTKEAKFQPYLLSLENNSDIDIFID